MTRQAGLGDVAREWGRLGVVGFGGPPAHVALLRELCVERRGWLDAAEFEDANAACQLLPGPASTQLAIYCARRVAGIPGGLVGGLAFILPGLVAIIVLAALTLRSAPPDWARGIEAGAGAAVLAVVLKVGYDLARTSLRPHAGLPAGSGRPVPADRRGRDRSSPDAGVVIALLACGLAELVIRRRPTGRAAVAAHPRRRW